MEPFMTSTVPPKYHSAFSFPLCYATTSDASSSSETATSGLVLKPAWEANSGRRSTEWCDLDVDASESSSTCFRGNPSSQELKCKETPLLVPPPTVASWVTGTGPSDDPTAHVPVTTRELAKDHITNTPSYMESQGPQGVAHSAPAALALAPSRGTSVTSSFSSESVPVVTTSQGSTDRNGSSCIASGVTDGDALPLSKELHKEGSPVHPVAFKRKAQQAAQYSLGSTRREARCDALGDDSLTNNSELTLSLESVLTVIPQARGERSSSQGKSDSDKRRQYVDGFPSQGLPPDAGVCDHGPRHSTSSFGEASLQSWDSHLEVDQAIEDIVGSVIQDLSIYEADVKSYSGTFSQEDSVTGDLPRKASPASMSSYASSKPLEWDNGADIGYLDCRSKSQVPEKMGGLHALSHHGKLGYSYVYLHGSKSKGDSLPQAMFSEGNVPTPAFRDVVVQTEVCPIRDAEVQASVFSGFEDVQAKAVVKEPLTRLSSSISSSANADSSSSSTKRGCTLSVSSEKSKCSSTRRKGHISSAVGTVVATNHNPSATSLSPTMESTDKLSINGSHVVPPRDCARCVSLSFSHKSFRDSSSCKDKSLVSESAVTDAVVQKPGRVDSAGELARNATPRWPPDKESLCSDSLCSDIGNLTLVKANRLKMRLPNAVKRLASRSNTPVEAPWACSELNKRRLDYWLSSGFPYVPAVAPLEMDILPHTATTEPSAGSKDALTDQLTMLGSGLPLITSERRPHRMEPKQAHIKLQAPSESTLTRKRYVARSLALTGAKVSSQAVTVPAVGTVTSRDFMTRDKQKWVLNMSDNAIFFICLCMETTPLNVLLSLFNYVSVSTGISESSSELLAKPVAARARRSLAISKRSRDLRAQYTSTSYDTASEGVPPQPLAVSGTGCKLKRIARKELEKLKVLVDRQRNSYVKQLQKEVERLHRLQELFLLAEDNRPTSSQTSTAASDSVEVSHAERVSTSEDNYSVGVQTSSSLLESERERTAKERYFVSMGVATAKKKQRAGLSPFTKRSRTRRPGVAWVVPLETAPCPESLPSEAPAKSNHVQADEDLSLQAAFAAHCGHLIQRFQTRQLQVATLAKRRQHHQQPPMLMHFVTKNHVQAQQMAFRGLNQPRRTFSHREMRDQTEKVYQKLPEVVDKSKKVHREQQYRTNRLMAQIYNKAIQEKALKGHVNFAINRPSAKL
ncbi:unnamed protein product [Ixodes hexagonus]